MLMACFCVVLFLSFDTFSDRIIETVMNTKKMLEDGDYRSSAGSRLESYRAALNARFYHPFTGVGVGDVVSTLKAMADLGEIRVLTDNVHSEFMNMLMMGGLPAMVLFASFIGSIFYLGVQKRVESPIYGDALICISVMLFVFSVFNSTIKDYGEKHALMIMLSLLGSELRARAQLARGSYRSKYSLFTK